MGCIAGSSGYVRVFKGKITGHPKFHPQMFMFILETMLPQVEPEGVSAACTNVSALHVTIQNLSSSVDDFDSRLFALEATTGLEVGGGEALSRNSRRKQNRRIGTNEGNSGGGIVGIPLKNSR